MLRPDRPLCPADARLCIRELRFRMRTPFAAFAVVAAAMLPLAPALLVVAAASQSGDRLWLPGIPRRHPHGLVGFASSRARCNCDFDFRAALRQSGTPVALGFALTGAYTAYELVLFAATPILGGAGAFTLTIVGRLGVLSPLWLIELVAAYEVFRLLNPIRRRNWQMPRRLSWAKVTVRAIVVAAEP